MGDPTVRGGTGADLGGPAAEDLRPGSAPALRGKWRALVALTLPNLVIQALWITYAPVTDLATAFYRASPFAIGAFAMVFMVAFLPLSIPTSAAIDRWGVRWVVGAGSVLATVGALLRAGAGDGWALAFAGTVLLAIAQPALINSWTANAAAWFPLRQRATAISLVTLGSMLGMGLMMAAAPALVHALGFPPTHLVLAVAMLVSTVAFLLAYRDGPQFVTEKSFAFSGLGQSLRSRSFLLLLAGVFVVMGAFNGVTTWINELVRPRGMSEDDAGLVGAAMLLAGLVGAVVLSTISDRIRRRAVVVAAALAGAGVGLLAFALAGPQAATYAAAALLGFFLTGTLPVGLEYAAELTAPAPAAMSNGVVQLVGQASVVVVYAMEVVRSQAGAFTPALVALAALLIVGAAIMARLRDRYHDDPALETTNAPSEDGAN